MKKTTKVQGLNQLQKHKEQINLHEEYAQRTRNADIERVFDDWNVLNRKWKQRVNNGSTGPKPTDYQANIVWKQIKPNM